MKTQKVNELYFEYKRKVYKIALSYVRDHYLAEDLTHEILLKCYLKRTKFNRVCSLDTWIYRVAKNHCIDFLRRNHSNWIIPFESVKSFKNGEVCTPEYEVINRFDNKELRKKVQLLPKIYEEVITLYYFKHQSLKEIQCKLGIKLSTVKTRLFRAKRLLKAMN